MNLMQNKELVKVLVTMVLREISMILCGDISDPINVENTLKTFDELPMDAKMFIINNIYIPKTEVHRVSISDMAEMQDRLKSRL